MDRWIMKTLLHATQDKVFYMIFSVVLLMPFNVQADKTPEALIKAMVESIKTSNYKGYFIFEQGDNDRSFFIAHKLIGGEEHQRLVFMDGAPLEISGVSESPPCHLPHMLSEDSASFPSFTALSNDSIWQHYNAAFDGEMRVAGRYTQRVILTPRDDNRYSYVFDVDQESHLLMRMLMLDLNGQPLERLQFIQLQLDTVSTADLEPNKNNVLFSEYDAATTDSTHANKALQLKWQPSGFEQTCALLKTPGGGGYDHASVFSDGVTAFSVFVQQSDSDYHRDLSMRSGGTSAVSHVFRDDNEQYLVTVVGEIPVQTAKQIAFGVRVQR